MKYRSLTLLALTLMTLAVHPNVASAQSSCCSAPQKFAAFASNDVFRMAHESPKAFVQTNALGAMSSVTLPDGTTASVYKVQATSPSNATILVFHEWWGLNDNVKNQCDSIAQELHGKATIIAVDLYHGLIATTGKDAAALMQNSKDEYSRIVINAVLTTIPPDQKIGTVGWCFGGGWSLQASIMLGKRGAACVIYYGMPEFSQQALVKLHAPVLGIYGTKDDWITPELVEKFNEAMHDAGKRLTVKRYEAVHAFANPSNANHDSKAAKDAFQNMIGFFNEHLLK